MKKIVAVCLLALTVCGRTYEDTLKTPDTERPILTARTGGAATKKLDPLKAPSFDGVVLSAVMPP